MGAANPGVGQCVHDNRHRIERVVLGPIRLVGRQDLIHRLARAATARSAARIAAGAGIAIGIGGSGMSVMMVMAAGRLSQILDVGELAALRGVGEVRGKLVELVRRCRIAVRLGSLSGALEVRRDLLCELPVLGWIRLLKLLERAHQLGER